MARDNSIDSGAITTRLRTLSDEMPLTVLVVDDDELERALVERFSALGLTPDAGSDMRH